MKAKKTTFAYEEAHPEDGPFCWNRINEEIMHEHHGWQMKKGKAITNIRSISNDRKTKTINGASY